MSPHFDKKPTKTTLLFIAIMPFLYLYYQTLTTVFVYHYKMSTFNLEILFLQFLFLGVPAIGFLRHHQIKNIFEKNKLIKKIGFILVLSFVATLVLNIIFAYWLHFFPAAKTYSNAYKNILHPGSLQGLFFDLLTVALTPALCEEFFFRGVIQTSLGHYGGKAFAIWGSALFFMLYHVNPYYAPFYFLLGLFWGEIFERTKNIFLSSLAHFINNATAIIVFHFFTK